MEWTLGHEEPDSRGIAAISPSASAPTEPDLRLGVRVNDPSSTYKQALLEMDPGDEIIAGQLSGDFTMPKDPDQPLVFVARGIGITPYRSMIKYLLDTHQRRPITLFYSARKFERLRVQRRVRPGHAASWASAPSTSPKKPKTWAPAGWD